MRILNVTSSEFRDIISVAGPDSEEKIVFLGFFVNLMRTFGFADPSNPDLLKFGLSVLERFPRPKIELPVVSPDGVTLWVGVYNNKQLICSSLSEGLIFAESKIDKKIDPTVTMVQYNIAATELYPTYLESYLKNRTPVETESKQETEDNFVPANQA